MISAYLGVLDREFSGERAQRHVVEIGRHYRSPGSDGYQATIEYVKEVLGSLSVDYRVREFPLDGKTTILEESVPLAWEPVGGSLEFVSPDSGTLVRWDECPSCIPWWCPPTPRGGVELEVVDVGTGATDEDYKGRDVRGKAVLVTDIGENFAWRDIVVRAQHHGAAGIITNYLLYQYLPWRTREALPEAVQQLRLPVKDSKEEYRTANATNWIVPGLANSLAISKSIFLDSFVLKKLEVVNNDSLTLANDLFGYVFTTKETTVHGLSWELGEVVAGLRKLTINSIP